MAECKRKADLSSKKELVLESEGNLVRNRYNNVVTYGSYIAAIMCLKESCSYSHEKARILVHLLSDETKSLLQENGFDVDAMENQMENFIKLDRIDKHIKSLNPEFTRISSTITCFNQNTYRLSRRNKPPKIKKFKSFRVKNKEPDVRIRESKLMIRMVMKYLKKKIYPKVATSTSFLHALSNDGSSKYQDQWLARKIGPTIFILHIPYFKETNKNAYGHQIENEVTFKSKGIFTNYSEISLGDISLGILSEIDSVNNYGSITEIKSVSTKYKLFPKPRDLLQCMFNGSEYISMYHRNNLDVIENKWFNVQRLLLNKSLMEKWNKFKSRIYFFLNKIINLRFESEMVYNITFDKNRLPIINQLEETSQYESNWEMKRRVKK